MNDMKGFEVEGQQLGAVQTETMAPLDSPRSCIVSKVTL